MARQFLFWGQQWAGWAVGGWDEETLAPPPLREWAGAWESVSMCACQASHSTSQLAADAFQLKPRKFRGEAGKLGKPKTEIERESERDRDKDM